MISVSTKSPTQHEKVQGVSAASPQETWSGHIAPRRPVRWNGFPRNHAAFVAAFLPSKTLLQTLTQIGRRAIARLLDALSTGSPLTDDTEHLPVELVVRSSTCPPRQTESNPYRAADKEGASLGTPPADPLSFPLPTKE